MNKLIYLLPVLLAFGCQQNTGSKQNTNSGAGNTAAMNENLRQLFEEINVVKMHLFATQEADPKVENFPYVGKPVQGEMLKQLDDALQPNETGGIYACYHVENNDMYILRVPGKYVSSDLVLCKWDAASGKLKLVQDLAYIQCDEGLCHQQDAWLTDLNDNRKLELVIRSRETEGGKLIEETFNILAMDEQGNFVKSDEQLASLALKENYVMHQ